MAQRASVLLERAPLLAELREALGEATGGRGCLVLVGGEAGIGKTALVTAFANEQAEGVCLLHGACDAMFTPRPLGALHDIASQLGGELSRGLENKRKPLEAFAALLGALKRRPSLVILEDLHWADEATLDLVKYLGRRIAATSSLVLATYRDDEMGADHPLRILLGDLATMSTTRRLRVPPLSVEAVRTLIGSRRLDPAQLRQQTGGNPFFVTEVLAAPSEDIPLTVRDAVLARAARLSPQARAVLETVAVAGPRVEPTLLAALAPGRAEATTQCLSSGMLVAADDALTFRHEIERLVILGTMSPPRRLELHRATLAALREGQGTATLARLAHHAQEAADPDAVLNYAPRAAREAASANAHREAAAQYRRALRFADLIEPAERARLLDAYALECHTISAMAEAAAARERAAAIWRDLGERAEEAVSLSMSASALFFLGRNDDAEAASRLALGRVEGLPDSAAKATAFRHQATLRMLARDHAEAIEWGNRAMAMAEVVGDFETLAASYNTVGTATLFLDYEKGCELLGRCREIATTRGYDAMVANTWSNLGTASGELHRFVEAEPLLSEGIDYAADRELDAQAEYMRSWRALARMHLGRWSEAGSEAAVVAERAAQGSISRIMALVALGRLRARRGDPGVWAVLDEALEIARRSGHLQRIAPVAAARAEAAALEGRRERAGVEATLALDPAMRNRHPWFAGELLYWQLGAGQAVESPEWIAPPFALQISGRWVEAAAEWEQRRCPYERARALAEGDGPMRRAALDIFDRLGARPAGEALRQRLRADGVGTVPRGPRASTRTNPYGLTAREVEILARLAEGLRNAEIAARLHISARTVDHHVSSILAKLEVPSREAAARFAAERGLLPPN